MTPDDIRGQRINIRVTPDLKTAVQAAATAEGKSASGWFRDAALTAAGHQDTARRPAPRRANRQPRQSAPGSVHLWMSVSGTEKDAIEHAAGGAGNVSGWLEDVIAAALGHAS